LSILYAQHPQFGAQLAGHQLSCAECALSALLHTIWSNSFDLPLCAQADPTQNENFYQMYKTPTSQLFEQNSLSTQASLFKQFRTTTDCKVTPYRLWCYRHKYQAVAASILSPFLVVAYLHSPNLFYWAVFCGDLHQIVIMTVITTCCKSLGTCDFQAAAVLSAL
jgi:hypothetical protein